MGLVKGGFQRLLQTTLYFILFLVTGIILGFYSYFLSVLADRHIHIPTWEKAVEGISGAAVLYLIFATILTCCLGGITGLAIIAIILDLCFAGGMIAIIVLTRHGADSCKGHVKTPLGNGPASQDNGFGHDQATYSVHLGLACKFNTVCFACAILAAILFLCTAAMQLLLMRKHKNEKRFGPSPGNNYTSGSSSKKSRFGGFGRKKDTTEKSTEAGALPASANHDNRVSGETGYTGTTMGNNAYDGYDKTATHAPTGGHSGYYDAPTQQPTGGHSGYYTAPTGTSTGMSSYGQSQHFGANPYGYNTNTTATNY